MQTEIIISEEIKNAKSGIYLLTFSNGYFYIGSSKNIKNRIRTHIKCINSNFLHIETCKALTVMNGFKGKVKVSLLLSVQITGRKRSIRDLRLLLTEESKILIKFQEYKKCLNWNRKAYKRAIQVKCYY